MSTPPIALTRAPARLPVAPLVGGLALLGWAFLPTFEFMQEKWADDPQYSHGYLVPLFSGYLLWRAHQAGKLVLGPTSGLTAVAGGVILAVALALRGLAGGLMFHQLDAAALLVTLAGVAVLAGGFRLLRAAAPAILFLAFMVPLPYEVERNVGGPLKELATAASTALLQTLGLPAVAEGHVILIDEVRLGVVDACSGLKMLVTFAAFAAGAVVLLDRTRFEKVLIAAGVVPIAVVTNVLRIAATGVTYTATADKPTQHFLHDFYGWVMMPLGLALLGAQLWCLGRLVVRPAAPGYAPPGPAFA